MLLCGFDLAADPGFAGELADNLRTREVSKPKRYVEAALRRRCDEIGVDLESFEPQLRIYAADLKPTPVEAT